MSALTKTQPSFYVGRESFEMRPSAHNMPLTGGEDPQHDALTRAPTAPHPTLQADAAAEEDELVPAIRLALPTLIGLLLTAFACGIMATIAVDHAFPQDDGPAVASSR
jgi:hypothetical protein